MTATCFDKTNYSPQASPTYDLSSIPQLESFFTNTQVTQDTIFQGTNSGSQTP